MGISIIFFLFRVCSANALLRKGRNSGQSQFSTWISASVQSTIIQRTSQMSYEQPQRYLSLLKGKCVLVVGDGDFSFSRGIAELQICQTLHTSTLETSETMQNIYPWSLDAVRSIEENQGSVLYGIDATRLSASTKYDVVLWNFPHVKGKQNNRYNRNLLQSFFRSSQNVLASDSSCVLISLCEGQSGFDCSGMEEWNASWKLIEQSAEAELLVTDTGPFPWKSFAHYQLMGHRGTGRGFTAGAAEYFVLQRAARNIKALQAPLYASELHFRLPLNSPFSQSLSVLEDLIRSTLQNSFPSISEVVHRVDIVDIYRIKDQTDPVFFVAVQVTYQSLTQPLSRNIADQYRHILEQQLPAALGIR